MHFSSIFARGQKESLGGSALLLICTCIVTLRSCIVDYGPLHGFWCYAFERYNGMLGSMPNNNRSIEIQLTSRFLKESQSLSAKCPTEFAEHFGPLFRERNTLGSVVEMMFPQDTYQVCIPDSLERDPSFVLPVHCSRTTLTSSSALS